MASSRSASGSPEPRPGQTTSSVALSGVGTCEATTASHPQRACGVTSALTGNKEAPETSKRSRAADCKTSEDDKDALQQLLEEVGDQDEYIPLKKRRALKEQLLKKQLKALDAHLEREDCEDPHSDSEVTEAAKEKQAKQKEAGW